MIEAKIFNLAITEVGFHIMLKPVNSEKIIDISIAYLEAQSIMASLIGYKIERPLTHDLINNIFTNCDIRLINVIIDNVHSETFFAKLVIEHNGKNILIDARPSDAIALAVKFNATIFIEEHVVENAGIVLSDNENLAKAKNSLPFTYPKFEREDKVDNKIKAKDKVKEIKENKKETSKSINKEAKSSKKAEIQKLIEQAVKEERYEDAAKYREELDQLEE